jgi:hypothetical protein
LIGVSSLTKTSSEEEQKITFVDPGYNDEPSKKSTPMASFLQ